MTNCAETLVFLKDYLVTDENTFPTSELIAVVMVDASDDDTLLTGFQLLSGENTTTIFKGKAINGYMLL